MSLRGRSFLLLLQCRFPSQPDQRISRPRSYMMFTGVGFGQFLPYHIYSEGSDCCSQQSKTFVFYIQSRVMVTVDMIAAGAVHYTDLQILHLWMLCPTA